jgi:uncharacterized protein YsxB (DUF464 family)
MIRIIVSKKEGHFTSLEVKGHANSAPKGEDLVCSAVSAIVIGGLNALNDEKGDYETKIDEGYVSIKALKPVKEHDELVFEIIVKQLERIAQDYPSNARLERKEA